MFKLIGVNIFTGNQWDCVTDIATKEEALELRRGWTRLESDYKVEYLVKEQ